MKEGWMKNDEGWMKSDEWWMMKDDDFKLLRGFADGQTNEQTIVIVESLLQLKTMNEWMYSFLIQSFDVFCLSFSFQMMV